jgi:hypothetical protein
VIFTKSHLTFGQSTKLQLTRSYSPTNQALADNAPPHHPPRPEPSLLDLIGPYVVASNVCHHVIQLILPSFLVVNGIL